MIIGVDEVGRGCIAGDLLVVSFAFRQDIDVSAAKNLCADSKSFSSRLPRERVYDVLLDAGVYHFAWRSVAEIERLNIRGATLNAMAEAALVVYARLNGDAECIFDGRDVPLLAPGIRARSQVKGDASIAEIGAASILAKVTRDRVMEDMAEKYPGYGFEKHAGYGTKAHTEAIKTLGLSPIHRSWAEKFTV